MSCRFTTDEFDLEYIESEIDHPVLWESHCHAKFEIIAVVTGDINIMSEGKSCRLKSGQAVIIPPLSYHSVTANEKGVYSRITALFDITAIPEILRSEFAKKSDTSIFTSSLTEKLKDICEKTDEQFYSPLAQSLMIQIFYNILQDTKNHQAAETDAFLQKVIAYIDENLHKRISLDDLAKYTARSKSSFCHLFEAKMNISPKQYILQKKLALASKLINDGLPSTTAAMQVGYDNYSNFYRLYLKHFGKSPAKEKNNIQKSGVTK